MSINIIVVGMMNKCHLSFFNRIIINAWNNIANNKKVVVMHMWFILALGGALLWGLHYPLLEKALQDFEPLTLMFLTSSVMTIVILIFHKELFAELKGIYHAENSKKLILAGVNSSTLNT